MLVLTLAGCGDTDVWPFDDVFGGDDDVLVTPPEDAAPEPLPDPPEWDVDDGSSGPVPPGLIGEESSWCWFVKPVEERLVLYAIGLDSGTIEPYGRFGEVDSGFTTTGLAFTGSSFVMGDSGSDTWHELDLVAGTHDVGPGDVATRNGVSWADGMGLVVLRSDDELEVHASFDDLVARAAPVARVTMGTHFERFHVVASTLYGAWHATDEILVYDLAAAEQIGTIPLEGYDGWVRGISVAGGRLHLLDDAHPSQPARLWRFDLDGTAVDATELVLSSSWWFPSGLWCEAP